jgi:hypothetical protein
MLLEFSMVLRRLGRSQEALDVNRHAAELPGDDDSGPAHAAWVGLMDVLSGRTGDRWLIAKPEELDQPFRFVAEVTWAVRAVAQAKPGQRTTGFADARRRLAEAVRSHGSVFADPVLKQIHNEVVRRIAAHVGGLRGWLWSLLHRLG